MGLVALAQDSEFKTGVPRYMNGEGRGGERFDEERLGIWILRLKIGMYEMIPLGECTPIACGVLMDLTEICKVWKWVQR